MPWIMGFFTGLGAWFFVFKKGDVGLGDLLIILVLSIAATYAWAWFDKLTEKKK